MKLYYSKGACSLAVRIIINELGLSADYESVDLKNKKTESGQDFLLINAKGAVPVLQTEAGEILTENAVILQYLADSFKADALLPPLGDFKRYRVLEWVNFITTELHKTIALLFNPNLSQETRDKMVIPLIQARFGFINQRLGEKGYLMGNAFSLPDAYLLVMLLWARYFKIDISEFSRLKSYFTALLARKSVQESLKQEGMGS